MDVLEWIAVAFGLACVYLTTRQNIWCWPTGVVMVSLYFVIFYQARLYSDMGLQVIYFVLQFYGWYQWLYGGRGGGRLAVSRIAAGRALSWAAAALLGIVALGAVMDRYTDADLAYWDASTTILSLIAQYWMSRKILENWLVWITVDVMAVGIYSYKELYLTSGLYFVFLIICISGWMEWRKTLRPDLEAAAAQPAA